MDGVDGGVGVRQVGVGRVLALGVWQRRLWVGGREIRGLEVRGRSVAERRCRGVGGLVQGGQLGEAPARRGAAESLCALLEERDDPRVKSFHLGQRKIDDTPPPPPPPPPPFLKLQQPTERKTRVHSRRSDARGRRTPTAALLNSVRKVSRRGEDARRPRALENQIKVAPEPRGGPASCGTAGVKPPTSAPTRGRSQMWDNWIFKAGSLGSMRPPHQRPRRPDPGRDSLWPSWRCLTSHPSFLPSSTGARRSPARGHAAARPTHLP